MINGTVEQFQKFATDYNKMMMESWSNWTKQTIQSDSFASASGAMMDWSLATHKMMTELSGQMMESMDIPRRSDLARLSAQVQSVETRLLEQEESQEEIRDLLVSLLNKLDSMPATPPATTAAPVQGEPQRELEPEPESQSKKTASKAKKTTRSKAGKK